MNKFHSISLQFLTLFLGLFNTLTTTAQETDNPNIIYILADDLGYGDVKAFNPNGKIPTPNIDKMASNGVMFTDAHTSSSVCTPTRYGILTGRYNWRSSLKSGVLSGYSKSLIEPDRTTVADILKKQGYTTAYIGKWHMGWDWNLKDKHHQINNLRDRPVVNFDKRIKNGPSTHGFDYSFGFCGSLDMPPYVFVENDLPTMIPTKETISVDAKSVWRKGLTSDDFVHATILQDLTDRAVSYIDKSSEKEEPFFLYLPLPAPHTPILPTTEFLGKSNTNMYGDFVMQVDDVVGQIREILKKKGISENTLLVFTSDNGCSPKANFDELKKVNHKPNHTFRGAKADIYEGGHHVPFLIEWPKKAQKNISIDKTICTTDFFATCAEIAGYETPDTEGEDSYSMLPLVTGKNNKDIREYIVHHSIDGSFAIKKGDWKLALCPGSAGWTYPKMKDIKKAKNKFPDMQLFNLKEDIGETKNLIANNPKKAKQLKKALQKIILKGRSTKGSIQENEGMDDWKQLENVLDNYQPAKKIKLEYVGVAAEQEGMHVWGSSPVFDKEGKVHLFAAQWSMATQTNFSGWYKDCEIGHYIGDSPEGPFKYVGVAVDDKDGLFNSPHNPTVNYIDGRYVLCFIVNENNKLKTQRIVMYVADDLNDTWRPAKGAEADGTMLRKPEDPTKWNFNAKLGVSNPSLIKYKGKYLLYHKSVIPKQPKGSAYTYGVAIADDLEGPYVIQQKKITPPKMQLEDAYAFTMDESVYLISRDFGATLGNNGGGLLWKSPNGLMFDSKKTKRAYEDLAHYLGKETLEKGIAHRGRKDGHLERAQILNIDNKPAYLYLATGVQVKPGYGSNSHVFKISFE